VAALGTSVERDEAVRNKASIDLIPEIVVLHWFTMHLGDNLNRRAAITQLTYCYEV